MDPQAKPLAGKSALITGASRRLGRDVALALASGGAAVAVHYRSSEQEALDLASAIRAKGAGACTIRADLSDPRQAAELLSRACEAMGPMDILINNASVFSESRIESVDTEEITTTIQSNALAPLQIARAFAAQGRPGDVVNFLDCRIADHDASHAAYHLSKRMLFTLTRMMALEFAPAVRVNAVAPGLILPPAGKDESYLQRLAHTNPLGRHGSAHDVVQAVLFLLGAEFITGQVIFVDGGRNLLGCVYG